MPGEWPKWLGPNGTGISTDKIAEQWPTEGPAKLWSQKKVGARLLQCVVGSSMAKSIFWAIKGPTMC